MTAAEAITSLRQLAASVAESRPGADVEEALAARLLERISVRANASVMRAGLVELGARSLHRTPPGTPSR